MNMKATEFLNDLAGISPAIMQARDETIAYWAPDEPPITVAFAEVGHALVDEIAILDNSAREAAFLMIEEGISSEDEQLSTAVATGLIEAMVGHAAKRGSYSEILALLGSNSRLHAKAWHEG